MISYLKVENLAIVAEAEIEPGENLNVLTGETGAGKSLLIDSLQFLSGARGSTDMIRTGADKLVVQAVIFAPSRIGELIDDLSIEYEKAGSDEIELVVRREMSASGRGRAQINGTTITVRDLSSLMDHLIEIHGQHQSVSRIGGRTWREMLDEWAGHDALLGQARRAYDEWRESSSEVERLETSAANRAERIDTLRFQTEELSNAAVEPGETRRLKDERSVLVHSEELAEATSVSLELILESDDSASSLVGRVSEKIGRLADKVESLRAVSNELEDILIRLEEVGRSIASLGSEVRHDPERLDEIESRLALLERLERKYGRDDTELPDLLESLREEAAGLEDFDSNLQSLRQKEHERFEEWLELANELSKGRRAAASEAAAAIEAELGSLAMERARVRFDVATRRREGSRLVRGDGPVAFGPDGFDVVELQASTNPGQPPRDLTKIASGGELSRLQLAIASATTGRRQERAPSTLVFDEIDAGVSGRVADVVGRKLKTLSRESQVICVTHLPQIAGQAEVQFHVEKRTDEEKTTALVSVLSEEQRVSRIAEMLAGESVTDAALANARALLSPGERSSR